MLAAAWLHAALQLFQTCTSDLTLPIMCTAVSVLEEDLTTCCMQLRLTLIFDL